MIRLENLCKQFEKAGAYAVKNISLTVQNSEVIAIVGTSGSGKTTTLKMINLLVSPTSGQIWIDSEEASKVDQVAWRRKMGYVIQKSGLFPHLNVKQNITLLSKMLKRSSRWREERAGELLNLVGMDPGEYINRFPHELSGGQQQRVGIARALCENPPILLMDEPFGAVDPITRTNLHDEFIALNQKLNKTIILVTHDLSEAFKLANRVALMDQGQIVQMGNEQDFRQNPHNQFVRDFLAEWGN